MKNILRADINTPPAIYTIIGKYDRRGLLITFEGRFYNLWFWTDCGL
jgi:hypothetical protein